LSPAWTVEWLLARRRRRLFFLNAAVPLLLVAPVALSGAPPFHAAAVYSVLFVIFGVFGSAIPLVRDGGSGLLTRWHLVGMPPRELLTARLGAQTALDVLEASPAVALILLASGRPLAAAPALIVALPFALLVANALGAWAAALARSLAEAALFSSVLSLLLLHVAGTFRTPAPGTVAETLERVSPFRMLHEAFLGATRSPSPDPASWLGPLAAGAALLLGTVAVGPFLLERLRGTRET
jgi:hypothetical protein